MKREAKPNPETSRALDALLNMEQTPDNRPGTKTVMTLELTRGQIATLDHALKFYASKYQEMVGREKDPYQKQDLQNYIDRADELGRRLRPEIQNAPAKVKP